MTGKKKDLETVLESAAVADNSFSKEQLLMSERFKGRRDIVDALLDDGKLYTVKSVEEKIKKYMKGKVR